MSDRYFVFDDVQGREDMFNAVNTVQKKHPYHIYKVTDNGYELITIGNLVEETDTRWRESFNIVPSKGNKLSPDFQHGRESYGNIRDITILEDVKVIIIHRFFKTAEETILSIFKKRINTNKIYKVFINDRPASGRNITMSFLYEGRVRAEGDGQPRHTEGMMQVFISGDDFHKNFASIQVIDIYRIIVKDDNIEICLRR